MNKEVKTPSNPEGLSRVDGRLKVTGRAKYSAEYKIKDLTYGVLVGSTITKGTLKAVDTKKAENAPGVLAVLTYFNAPKIPGYQTDTPPPKGPLKIFYDDQVYFNGQPIALVVADTFERALFAASLVTATYAKGDYQTNLKTNLSNAFLPNNSKDFLRGQADAWKSAPVTVEQEYIIPTD